MSRGASATRYFGGNQSHRSRAADGVFLNEPDVKQKDRSFSIEPAPTALTKPPRCSTLRRSFGGTLPSHQIRCDLELRAAPGLCVSLPT
jgi:hypothetical protein